MKFNINVETKAKALKILGFVVTGAFVLASSFEVLPKQLDTTIIAILSAMGLWVLPSPILRTSKPSE